MTTKEEAFVALRKGGLIQDDRDLVALFDISQPDFVERARAAKPHLFRFDARLASPEEVEAKLAEIESTAARRWFNAECDKFIASLHEATAPGTKTGTTSSTARKPAPSRPERFNAMTASPEEVEARLNQLTGGR